MRRTLLALFLILSIAPVSFAQAVPEADDPAAVYGKGSISGTVYLSMTIRALSGIADSGSLGEVSGDTYLLYGTMSRAITASDDPFEAVAEYMEGEWVGTSKVVLHRVYLVFRGEAFRDFLAGSAGVKAVVVAQGAALRAAPDGSPAVYLDVVSVRPIY